MVNFNAGQEVESMWGTSVSVFGSGCFLIYIYSLFLQIADWSMVYTCMCAVVEDLTGLIDQFPFLVAFQTRGNL